MRPALPQAGLRPTSIELISVERVSEEARPSPWRAVLRAAGALRLPAGWHLPGATTAAAEEDRVGQVAALAADAALQQLAGLQPLPLGAAPSEAEERERQRQEWAALLAANGIDEAGQRLPLSAFDDAYLDGTDFAEAEQASGRRLKQVRAAAWARWGTGGEGRWRRGDMPGAAHSRCLPAS